MKKYLIEYELPYVHLVRVGIEAEDSASAIALAEEAFDLGTIWDNTPEMPLLYDDFEESAPPDHELEFKVADEGESWPEPAVCVKSYVQDQAAKRACEWLIAAFEEVGIVRQSLLHEALNEACKAMPHLADSNVVQACLGQSMPTVAAWIKGGIVQWMASDRPMRYLVLDADVEGGHRIEVTMENGNVAEVQPTATMLADHLPDWVNRLVQEIEAQ